MLCTALEEISTYKQCIFPCQYHGAFELITIASSGVCANVLNDFLKFFIWGGGGWRHLH